MSSCTLKCTCMYVGVHTIGIAVVSAGDTSTLVTITKPILGKETYVLCAHSMCGQGDTPTQGCYGEWASIAGHFNPTYHLVDPTNHH